MSGKVSVWPYRDDNSHRAEISYYDDKSKVAVVCSIKRHPNPDNEGVFSIQPNHEYGTTEKQLTSFLTTVSDLRPVNLRWYDVDDKQGVTNMNIKLIKLPGSYYSFEVVTSEGGPATKGGKSVRRHYRKRKSNRRVSNKKYSAASRRSGRVRRSRKN
jgi:hypothetical protein